MTIIRFIISGLFLFSLTALLQAQEESNKGRDNSKPTNVYSQVDNSLEFTKYKDYSTFGYNPKLSLAPNEDNVLNLEVPFLYCSKTNKFGMSDVRLRYFYIPYRDYSKTFGAFGTSMDITAPTGNYADGLGSSSWRISPGLTFGLMLNKSRTISAFPNISYTYTSKPTSEFIPADLREVDHGLNLSINTSFVLSDDAFILVTPIYDIKDLADEREDEFIIEIENVFDIARDKYQVGWFYRGAIASNTHTFRVLFTVFF